MCVCLNVCLENNFNCRCLFRKGDVCMFSLNRMIYHTKRHSTLSNLFFSESKVAQESGRVSLYNRHFIQGEGCSVLVKIFFLLLLLSLLEATGKKKPILVSRN